MNRRRGLVVLIMLLAGSGDRAAAQQIRSPYRFIDTSQYVGAFGGHVATSTGRLETGPEAAPIFGARWGMRVSGPFGVDVEIGYMPSKRVVRDTVFGADSMYRAVGEADMNMVTLLGNIRFNITGQRTWRNLQPFIKFGAGAAIDVSGDSEIEADLPSNARFGFGTSFAGQFGAGIEWFASSRVGVRLDASSLFWKLSVPEAFLLSSRGGTFPRSEWEQNLGLSAGLSIHF